jgi:hypothetical protein
MDHRSAARILDLAERPGSQRGAMAGLALIFLLAVHGARSGGFPPAAQATAMSSVGAESAHLARAEESPEMKRLMAIGAAAAMSAGVNAQTAVQWRIEDGGNGHWYSVVVAPPGISWTDAKAAASSRGGYLASIRSGAEANFLASLAQSTVGAFSGQPPWEVGPWIGASRILGTNNWRWMSSESWSFAAWCAGEPNGGSAEAYGHMTRVSNGICWNDREYQTFEVGNPSFIVESHTRPTGQSGAMQWTSSLGGNGHWYELVVFSSATDWIAAKLAAELRGGHLATLTSSAENTWVFTTIAQFANGWWCGQDCYGPWLGGFQDRSAPDFAEPGGGWRWVTGEPWLYTEWEPNLPNNAVPLQDYLHYYGPSSPTTFFTPGSYWDDMNREGPVISMVVEYDADCNGDGIVDFSQIRAGELADSNANNIPDCCEIGMICGCSGDTNRDGTADGIDLATVLTRWGQSAAKFPEADCNRDGVIDGSDLAIVLGSWGACP